MLEEWWTWACRRYRPLVHLDLALTQIAASASSQAPTPPLREWLAALDVLADTLSPQEAGQWLAFRRCARRSNGRHSLSFHQRGPTVRRCPAPASFRLGRRCYHPQHRLQGIRDDEGRWHSRPEDVLTILWRSRSPWWGSDPPLPAHGLELLTDYAAEHHVDLSSMPHPSYQRIANCILRAAGAAPGGDNRPYELYHAGLHFCTLLMSQAFLVAHLPGEGLQHVLGPPVDLLIWIPKKAGADRAEGQ